MTPEPGISETVSSLAALVGGRVVGDGSRRIRGVADLRQAGADRIGFVRDSKYRDLARETGAGAVLTYAELETAAAQIVVDDVPTAYAKVALHFHPLPRATQHRIHPSAVVAPGAELESPVELGPNVVVGRARIAAGTVVQSGTVIGDGCVIGRDCLLHPRVVLYPGTRLADRVVLHSGTVLGSDGFGYAKSGARYLKLPQVGTVSIEDDVEIGANCTVDRGAIGITRIGARTKIDNLCHVAHNVSIGEDCALAGASYVAGSTEVGDRVTLAGHVAIGGHLRIASDVRLAGNSCVLRHIDRPGDYMGHPLMEKMPFVRLMRTQRRLVDTLAELDVLRNRVAALENRLPGGGGEGS